MSDRHTPLLLAARAVGSLAVVAATAFAEPMPSAAQSISGSLLDLETDRPIPLGLIMMFTEAGDSVGSTITDGDGRFIIASPEPGGFVLLASALGYDEAPAGVFELGEGGSMEVQYRLRSAPLPLDEIIVSLDRPATEHYLVRNGFVRRLQRGLGRFITPYQIERSPARSTESLLTGIPWVRVATVPQVLDGGGIRIGLPRSDLGEMVQIAGPTGGWCEPTVYVDGVRVEYAPALGNTISQVAHRGDVEGVEVYRRPAEIPVEYSVGAHRECGVIVLWTKVGLAAGQRPSRAGAGVTAGVPLPDVPPVEGDVTLEEGTRIRMELTPEVATPRGLGSPWQGTLLAVTGGDLVASDPLLERAISVPLDGVTVLQVEQPRSPSHAYVRGALLGGAFTVGMYGMLRILCRGVCAPDAASLVLPSLGTGLFVGVMVRMRGPGTHWVGAPVPGHYVGSPPPGPDLSVRIPTRVP